MNNTNINDHDHDHDHDLENAFNEIFSSSSEQVFTTEIFPLESKKPSLSVDYLLVVDFEATCDDPINLYPQEIIEFPILIVDCNKKVILEEKFHYYIKPVKNPKITKFCTNLTGITQEMVDVSLNFKTVYKKLNQWLLDNNFISYTDSNTKIFEWITCGDWDFEYMFPEQLQIINQKVPEHFTHWLNIKHEFKYLYNKKCRGMPDLLKQLGLELEGRHHSGIDDARNIARCAIKMLDDGFLSLNYKKLIY